MVNARQKEVLKASTSKGAELLASDAEHDDRDNGSSSSSEDLNFRWFTDEETKDLSSMIRQQVGKTIKNVMPYLISQTTDNLKEIVRKELEEFKKGGIMNDFRNEMETYRDFTACDVPKFLWMLRCGRKERFARRIWKKFNDLIRYCPEYHGSEKLKVKRFQRMLRDDIRKVISPFKCTTLDDLLSRARVRETDLLRKRNKEEAKETKRKLELGDRDAKKPTHDQS
ncbi:hypothetical protein Tco_1315304 [Tanacetum coccineum]